MRMRILSTISMLVLALVLLAPGCSKKVSEQKQQAPTQLTTQAPPHSIGTPAVAGIRWTVPKGWVEGPPKQMRFATYVTLPAEKDAEGAECSVSFFGTGQGGNVDQNIDRWITQFENASAPSRSLKQISGLTVHLVRIGGSYVGMTGPMMQQGGGRKDNFRLLGAIVEAPEGTVFFKLTGPAKTIVSNEDAFDTMLESLQKI